MSRIAIIGATGAQGSGLTLRWARAGVEVVIGSRDAMRGAKKAAELSARLPRGSAPITGTSNLEAAASVPRIVVLTVPFSAHRSTLASIMPALAEKILIDVTVPLHPDDPKQMAMPAEGSATESAQAFLGDNVKVVAAFQNVSARVLDSINLPINCDILVCGNDQAAKDEVITLIELLNVKAYNAGPADSARCVEALTSILIRLNMAKAYPFRHAGIRIRAEEL